MFMESTRSIVYADRLYRCADGKTAHGLVRYSKRYNIAAVVDSTLPEGDAGKILDGKTRGIPLFNDLDRALASTSADVFIVGAVSEGGVLPDGYDKAVTWALIKGLDIVSGLHEFLSDNPHFQKLAEENNCEIVDVRKMYREYRRFYTGEIKNVGSVRVAILGVDSAVGKRTLAVFINEELIKRGYKSDLIFTGQTGWLQGWPHGIVLDAMVNDFIAGGIEGAILDAWNDNRPDFLIIEGQGSLVHPFFPGGFEILAAGNVHGFILVDAPMRPHLDGFPEYPMPDPGRVIRIAELLTEKPLLAIGINRENMSSSHIKEEKEKLGKKFKVPVVEPLSEGVDGIVDALIKIYDK
jgi:uncharacterized NAD-dependent epimerase/dehydratase family protein